MTGLEDAIAEKDETITESEEITSTSMSDETNRLMHEIENENKNLDRNFSELENRSENKPNVRKRPVFTVGILSSAASLIVIGIALIVSMFSPGGVLSALKIAPIALVFFGAEIAFTFIKKDRFRFKIDLKGIIISVSLIIVTALLSLVSLLSPAETNARHNVEIRLENLLAKEVHSVIKDDGVSGARIIINLSGDDFSAYETTADLTDTDSVSLILNFSDAQKPVREFARDCRKVLDKILTLRYNFSTVKFVADDNINHYELDVDCLYQSDYSAEQLTSLVGYYGSGMSDADIPDLVDDE